MRQMDCFLSDVLPTDSIAPPNIVMRLCDPLWSFSRVFSGGRRYMRAAEKHLDNVCKGQFP
jgi:hypothetical protein